MYGSNGREKNPADRIRRNAETYVIDNPVWDGKKHGPPLPRSRNWCDETRKWWDNWRTSDQSMLMTKTDWDFHLDTAVLHNMMWADSADDAAYEDGEGKRRKVGGVTITQLAGEIRQRVSKMGATYEDRKKLRMAVDCPATALTAKQQEALEAERAVEEAYTEMFKEEVSGG